jgi:hypothetical protein
MVNGPTKPQAGALLDSIEGLMQDGASVEFRYGELTPNVSSRSWLWRRMPLIWKSVPTPLRVAEIPQCRKRPMNGNWQLLNIGGGC